MNKASLLLKHASSAEEYKLLWRELRDFIDHILTLVPGAASDMSFLQIHQTV